MPDTPDKPGSLVSRLTWDDDNPVTITGRKARTRKVGSATLLASGTLIPHTSRHISHLRFDLDGNVIERHVRHIRP